MSRESIVKFYGEVDKNANLKREFDGLREKTEKGQITNEESIAKGIVSIARAHGFKFTEDELLSYMRDVQSTLSEEDLANISGGLLLEIGLGALMIFGGWAFGLCANTPRTHEAGQMEDRQHDVEEHGGDEEAEEEEEEEEEDEAEAEPSEEEDAIEDEGEVVERTPDGENIAIRYHIVRGVLQNDNLITLEGNEESPVNIGKIPRPLRNMHMKFLIGSGIKSVKIQGDDEVAVSFGAAQLESIDTSESNKYVSDEVALYEKGGGTEQRGRFVDIIRREGRIEEVKYNIGIDNVVYLSGDSSRPEDITEIPQSLRNLGMEFAIGNGIRSIKILEDDRVAILDIENSDLVAVNLPDVRYNINKATREIHLVGDKDRPADVAEIPEYIRNLHMKFVVNEGINSIKLRGNDEFGISEGTKLQRVDTDESDLYVADKVAVYEKDESKPRRKGDLVCIYKEKGKIGEIRYYFDRFHKVVYLDGTKESPITIDEIPHDLSDLQIPFGIGPWVRSIALKGNEEIEIVYYGPDRSDGLRNVDTSQSDRFMAKVDVMGNILMYEKNDNGEKGNLIWKYFNREKTEIDGVWYEIKEYDRDWEIIVSGNGIANKPVEFPENLRDLGLPFAIGRGIEGIVLNENDDIEFWGATDLKSVDTTRSNVYITDEDNVALYRKNPETGERGNCVKVINRQGRIGNVIYEIKLDYGWNRVILRGDEGDKPVDIAAIPESLRNLGMEFQIGEGIKSIRLQEGDKVNIGVGDLGDAKNTYFGSVDLEHVNTEESDLYVYDGVGLYDRIPGADGKRKLRGIIPNGKIGVLGYKLESYNHSHIKKIKLFVDGPETADVGEIPGELRALGLTFIIGRGIKSIELQERDFAEISPEARDLEHIGTERSYRYNRFERGVDGARSKLYECDRNEALERERNMSRGHAEGKHLKRKKK